MRKTRDIIQKGCKAVQDLNLLKLLRSEIQHELSSDPFPKSKSASLGDFVLEWDSPKTHDVFLRRKFECGEEVAISSKLGRFKWYTDRDDSLYTRFVDMKVCVKKPGLSTLLQFDCNVWEDNCKDSGFTIWDFYCHQSPAHLGPSVHRGRGRNPYLQIERWSLRYNFLIPECTHHYPIPSSPRVFIAWTFRSIENNGTLVESKLHSALMEYLVAKGIGEELTNFLLHHLHKKEQGQYINWLQKLESFVAKPVKPE